MKTPDAEEPVYSSTAYRVRNRVMIGGGVASTLFYSPVLLEEVSLGLPLLFLQVLALSSLIWLASPRRFELTNEAIYIVSPLWRSRVGLESFAAVRKSSSTIRGVLLDPHIRLERRIRLGPWWFSGAIWPDDRDEFLRQLERAMRAARPSS